MDEEIKKIKEELKIIREELKDVSDAIKCETVNTTDHINHIYQLIADIHDYLMPCVHKVFPDYAAAKKQIDEFMEGRGRRPGPSK
jgi:hypothetical protein